MTKSLLRHIIYERLCVSIKDDNIERLTQEQLEFITHDINIPCYLEACPGSGKTEVIGIKAAYELIAWKESFSGIAIVSFTNNASVEIEKRVKKYVVSNSTSHPHFIGTLDSFFYKYVLCPFFYGHVGFNGKNGDCSPRMIIDERSDADFLHNKKYQPKTGYVIPNPSTKIDASPYISIPISANKYYFDLRKDDFIVLPPIKDARIPSTLSDIINRPEQQNYLKPFSKWLTNKIIKDGFWTAKRAFWKDGFLTFRDSEWIIFKIIYDKPTIRKNLIKRFPYIIIDECQDLSPMQLILLHYLVDNGLKVFFIGDLNQSIYKFREVDPKLVTKFIIEKKLFNLHLSNNFRSNQQIVDVFCKVFPNRILGNEKQLIKSCLFLIEYGENEIPQLINRYQEIIIEANIEAKREIIKVYQSCIIIRGSSLLNRFRPFKTESNYPLTILSIALQLWNSENRNVEIIGSAISLFGCFLSKTFYKSEGNFRNQYCPEYISKTRWRISLSNLLTVLSKELFPFQNGKANKLTYSQWAVLVRNYIIILISKLPTESYLDINEVTIQVERGLGSIFVSDYVSQYKSSCKIRITTIHDVKGETLDSVMVVSSLDKKSKGGHWENWFNQSPITTDDFEHKRYGYVALSRPKHLLVLALPKLNSLDKVFFEKMGFKIENLKTKALF